jgi:3-deoxy-manno-octulosonate cytidylyltransferase (CMP-KDO synthetase)
MKITAIIPARFASTRFPGKPLVNIQGRSMIHRVAERVCCVIPPVNVFVATDDQRIFDHVLEGGFQALMTSSEHKSGTDRCAEAARKAKCREQEIILNIQGDEPYIKPEQIRELISCFEDPEVSIGSLCRIIEKETELVKPNLVKVVRNLKGDALFFSRSVIPFNRSAQDGLWLKDYPYTAHIGLYGFRMKVLQKLCQLPETALEKTESLEQLRWLDNGFPIRVKMSNFQNWAIDSPEDLENLPIKE